MVSCIDRTSSSAARDIGASLKGPVVFRVLVQVAEDGDDVTQHIVNGFRKIILDPVPRWDGIDPSGDPLIEVRSDV